MKHLRIPILLVLMALASCSAGDGGLRARKTQWKLERRMEKLERFADAAMKDTRSGWMDTGGMPEDMVIYRYEHDTLQSWAGTFPVAADETVPGEGLILLAGSGKTSPLAEITDTAAIHDIGPKRYLAKKRTEGSTTLIYGLLINDSKNSDSEGGASSATLFSPTLYADGSVLSSLGAVLIINLNILLLAIMLRLALKRRKTAGDGGYKLLLPHRIGIAAACCLILLYSHVALRSIVLNSNISLEIYKYSDLSRFSILTILSFLTLYCTVPLLLDCIVRKRKNLLKMLYCLCVAVYFVTVTAVSGFEKEQNRLDVAAGRIALDRDIALELTIRKVENEIAEDPVTASLTLNNDGGASLLHRIRVIHFPRISHLFDIEIPDDQSAMAAFRSGEPIGEGSRFVYTEESKGHPCYTGLFVYNIPDVGLTRFALRIEPRPGIERKGYYSILGISPPGKVRIPAQYSYARYIGRRIISFRGEYAYPTTMNDALYTSVYSGKDSRMQLNGFTHFIYNVTQGETVIISRANVRTANYIIAALFLALLLYFAMSAGAVRVHRDGRRYYRTRITRVLMEALWLTLVAMALVSVIFVYRRNARNSEALMSEKINSIQAMVQGRTRDVSNVDELRTPEFRALIERIGAGTNSDITLYAPDGKVFASTAPMLFESLVLDPRINGEAYRSIVGEGRRYFLHREKAAGHVFYNMYAPLLADDGSVTAILCSPYAEDSYDFRRDAVNHSMSIISVFLILMLLARFMAHAVVDRMFNPLIEMSRKMAGAGLESLEPITYDRDDEISSIVEAYNRMVRELSESTVALARAEREKAWSGMARQVAHEIKNPLTPMKLQLQRIIRLKQKNDPHWQEKFDEVTGIILDHIDILTDTANEFSTFAKLYTEEPVDINLDALLQEEVAMFDSKGETEFEYIGLAGAMVRGPKPQLTRVFVNLISNAVQAVSELGDRGKVMVSLRKSSEDGFYDIVFEDNGPGVAPENVEKLFTPNFTTKNGGSGLGLAISRSVLESCSASISYSKSFVLGGACFLIKYPL